MELSTPRPQTPPPPPSYLLSPPPSGGLSERKPTHHTDIAGYGIRHLNKSKEGESPAEFFRVTLDSSDTEFDIDGEPSADDAPLALPALDGTSPLLNYARDGHGLFVSLALATEAPVIPSRHNAPFPFMQLPLSVRTEIYEHLLVVPALICVRQKHTSSHDEKRAFLYAEHRQLLPGIAYALAQVAVDGHKINFSRFDAVNINVLRVSKEVHVEAKAILYGKNAFEIVKPTNEMSPPPDFSIRLFPSGCQRLVTRLNIRIRSFYGLHWLLGGGHNAIKKHYRGLNTLTLILEIGPSSKGFLQNWVRKASERWTAYVKRLHNGLSHEVFAGMKTARVVPIWINLRVLFGGENYDETLQVGNGCIRLGFESDGEYTKREQLKSGLVEAWELFKKGGE